MPYAADVEFYDWKTLPKPGHNPQGEQVEQVFHVFPALKMFYPFEAENSFGHGGPASSWAGQNMHIAYTIVTVYVILTFTIKYALSGEKVKGFNVKEAWKWWNLGLSLFSFCGAMRTVPHLIKNIYMKGFEYTVCYPALPEYGNGVVGLWTMLFIFSKVPELFDTAFIVLGKKKLIFLHWYHHVTVLLYCWHSYGTRNAAGLWFIAMNYTVHAIMYFYYFLTGLGYRPKWAFFVTIIQISQMFVGVMVCIFHYVTHPFFYFSYHIIPHLL